MFRIERIHLQHFRAFEDWKAEFVDPAGNPLDYVVLAGPNGSGKTSVLEAILLALGREALIVRDLPVADRGRYPRAQLSHGASIDLRISVGGESLNLGRLGNHRSFTPERSKGLQDDSLLDAVLNEQAADRAAGLVERVQTELEVEYFSSRRIPAFVGPIEEAVRGRPPENTESNRIWRLKNLLLQQQGRRANPNYRGPEPLDRAWLERLNQFWGAFRADQTTLSLAVVNPEELERTEWDLYLFHGDERICPVESLSSGEIEVLSMAAPFVTRQTLFNGILLFDEPELHLHPEWQARVIPALRTLMPDAQIIVATHADAPWDNAYSFQRFLLVNPSDPRARRGPSTAERG